MVEKAKLPFFIGGMVDVIHKNPKTY